MHTQSDMQLIDGATAVNSLLVVRYSAVYGKNAEETGLVTLA